MDKPLKKPLGEIAEIIMGQSPESESYNNKGDGIPFYQGKSDFGEIYPSIRMYCSSPKKAAKANDILMSVRAPIGDVNIVQEDCCIGRGLAAIRPHKDVELKYLFYLLKYYKGRLEEQGTGSTFKAIGKDVLNDTLLPVWEFETQKDIAIKLDTVHSLIDNRQQAANILDDLVKSRFIEMFGDPNDETLSDKKKSIEDVCDNIYGGGTPSKSHKEYYIGNIPWVTPKDMKSMSIDDSQDHITSEAIENSTTKLIPKKSVLMVIRSGILKHTLPVAINNVEVTINQDMKAFVPSSILTPEYLLHTFKMMEESILSKVRGVTADNIEFSEFKKRQIFIPPIELQNQFADFVALVDKSKLAIKQSIDTLQTLKDKLMQDYFG